MPSRPACTEAENKRDIFCPPLPLSSLREPDRSPPSPPSPPVRVDRRFERRSTSSHLLGLDREIIFIQGSVLSASLSLHRTTRGRLRTSANHPRASSPRFIFLSNTRCADRARHFDWKMKVTVGILCSTCLSFSLLVSLLLVSR